MALIWENIDKIPAKRLYVEEYGTKARAEYYMRLDKKVLYRANQIIDQMKKGRQSKAYQMEECSIQPPKPSNGKEVGSTQRSFSTIIIM